MIPEAKTELRWFDLADREEYQTAGPGEIVEAALSASGRLHFQWRPQVAIAQLGQSITARSQAVVMLSESGVRLAWDLQLDLGTTPRDTVILQLPIGYQIESVSGDNVRGWKVLDEVAGRIEVTLLQATVGQERLQFILSRYLRLDDPAGTSLTMPIVAVPGSVLHQGHLSIQRSPGLELETVAVRGATREDQLAELSPFLTSSSFDSPLGRLPYQAFRFQADTLVIELQAKPIELKRQAKIEAIASLGRQEMRYEARIRLQPTERPWYQLQIRLPEGFQLEKVDAAGEFQTALSTDGMAPLLTVFRGVGQRDAWSLVVTGRLAQNTRLSALNAPVLQLLDVTTQRGQLVVQTDPAWEVTITPQRNSRVVPLSEVLDWYRMNEVELNRVVLAFDQADYAAQLQPRMRRALVDVVTISNARVTSTQIEDSLFLKFRISQAGIREVQFLVPAEFQDAQVQAPLLRRTSIEPVEGRPELRRFRLELQDDVTGDWLVLVTLDRALSTEEQLMPLITVEEARTQMRFAVLENVGRDELIIRTSEQVEALRREDPRWNTLAELLGEQITQAFVVAREAESPRLVYQALRRPILSTVGASIRLAETKISVDASGAYRALQLYRLDNQTEQVLEIELPAGAQLWTARVAGQPVKPAVSQGNTNGRFVRIPLMKTDTGDLDYPIELKYGGRIDGVGSGARFPFPLIRPVGIKMEQSQIRLWLPKEYRFFAFSGTLRRVQDEGELLAGYVAYRNRQIESLLGVLQEGGASQASSFSKLRAVTNLKQLEAELEMDLASGYQQFRSNAQLQTELQTNRSMLKDAERRLNEPTSELADKTITDHRGRLQARFQQQQPQRASGYLTSPSENFSTTPTADPTAPAKPTTPPSQVAPQPAPAHSESNVDAQWLQRFRVGTAETAKQPANARVILPRSELSAQQAQQPFPSDKGQFLPKFATDTPPAAEDRLAKPSSGEERKSDLQLQIDRYQTQLEQRNLALEPMTRGGQRRATASGSGRERADLPQEQASRPSETRAAIDSLQPAQPIDQIEGPNRDEQAAEALETIADRGLASLDVELPQRGEMYLFTTPGGDVELEARAVERLPWARLGQICILLLGFALLGLVHRYTKCPQEPIQTGEATP